MMSFQRGERVRINDGMFMNFSGIVKYVNVERKLLTVFDRSNSIELRFAQVRRAA
jgi:transcription antitermination factor NusG